MLMFHSQSAHLQRNCNPHYLFPTNTFRTCCAVHSSSSLDGSTALQQHYCTCWELSRSVIWPLESICCLLAKNMLPVSVSVRQHQKRTGWKNASANTCSCTFTRMTEDVNSQPPTLHMENFHSVFGCLSRCITSSNSDFLVMYIVESMANGSWTATFLFHFFVQISYLHRFPNTLHQHHHHRHNTGLWLRGRQRPRM